MERLFLLVVECWVVGMSMAGSVLIFDVQEIVWDALAMILSWWFFSTNKWSFQSSPLTSITCKSKCAERSSAQDRYRSFPWADHSGDLTFLVRLKTGVSKHLLPRRLDKQYFVIEVVVDSILFDVVIAGDSSKGVKEVRLLDSTAVVPS